MRLLVTGLSGFLGYALGQLVENAFEVVATFHENKPRAVSGDLVRVDLADPETVAGSLEAVRPQAVIHMAAISQPNVCETDQQRTTAVNVEATAAIARWCAQRRCPLVFTSTDLVFDGAAAPYVETDSTNPLNAYARQKVAAEKAVLSHHSRAVICRMPLMFGYGGPDGKGFSHEMVTAIAHERPVHLFTDEFRTPLSTACAAEALLAALDWPGGIYHLGGPERISRLGLGRRIAAHLGVGTAHLQPLTQDAMAMAAPRPADVSLENRKARKAGFSPAGLDEAVGRMVIAFGLLPKNE